MVHIYPWFPSDNAFALYRETVRARYDQNRVTVGRYMVKKTGHTVADVLAPEELRDELLDLAFECGGEKNYHRTLKV